MVRPSSILGDCAERRKEGFSLSSLPGLNVKGRGVPQEVQKVGVPWGLGIHIKFQVECLAQETQDGGLLPDLLPSGECAPSGWDLTAWADTSPARAGPPPR